MSPRLRTSPRCAQQQVCGGLQGTLPAARARRILRKGLVQPEAASAEGPAARGGVGSRRGREAGVKTPAFLPLLLLGSSQTALPKFFLPCSSLTCSMLVLPRCHQSIICPSDPWPLRSHPLPALGYSHQEMAVTGFACFPER